MLACFRLKMQQRWRKQAINEHQQWRKQAIDEDARVHNWSKMKNVPLTCSSEESSCDNKYGGAI